MRDGKDLIRLVRSADSTQQDLRGKGTIGWPAGVSTSGDSNMLKSMMIDLVVRHFPVDERNSSLCIFCPVVLVLYDRVDFLHSVWPYTPEQDYTNFFTNLSAGTSERSQRS